MNKLHLLSYDETSKQWKMTEDVDKMGTDLADLGLLKELIKMDTLYNFN
ncbi:hypothetical protein AAAC51_18635 [Priestia megaterium]